MFIRLIICICVLTEENFIYVFGYLFLLLPSSIIDWNNPLIVNKMYKVYLGDVPLKTKVCRINIFICNCVLFILNI